MATFDQQIVHPFTIALLEGGYRFVAIVNIAHVPPPEPASRTEAALEADRRHTTRFADGCLPNALRDTDPFLEKDSSCDWLSSTLREGP